MPDDDTDLHVRLARLEERLANHVAKQSADRASDREPVTKLEKKQDWVVMGLLAAAGSQLLKVMGWVP